MDALPKPFTMIPSEAYSIVQCVKLLFMPDELIIIPSQSPCEGGFAIELKTILSVLVPSARITPSIVKDEPFVSKNIEVPG